MKIKQLKISNFRTFKDISITFPDNNLAVFIGNNGSGKSSLLDCLAILLNQITTKFIRLPNSPPYRNGNFLLTDNDINNNENDVKIELCVETEVGQFCWSLLKNRFQKSTKKKIEDKDLDNYVNHYRDQISSTELPILIYYRTNRVISSDKYIFSTYRRNYPLSVIATYENAFSTKLRDFDDFVNWFRLEEDKENELITRERNFNLTNPQLEAVRQSTPLFFENLHNSSKYTNFRVERDLIETQNRFLTSGLFIEKDGIKFQLEQLSDGEKILMMTVCDIARRLAIANPNKEDVLSGNGVVLLDEIDLHLHPQWQQYVVSAFRKTFPNLQFILTTHSPKVLSQIPQESIFILEDSVIKKSSLNLIGRDDNAILEDLMQTPKRSEEIEKFAEEYFILIQKDELKKAEKLKNLWKDKLDENDPIFVKAQALITRKQLLKK